MREGWKYKKLGEAVQVLNGYAFKSNLYVDNGIRVMRITNVQKGNIVDDDPKFYPETAEDEIKNYLLKENDLLMSLTGNVGRVGLLQKDMLPAALNQRVACLRTKTNELTLQFLFHLLNSDMFEKDAILAAKGIAQKNMSTEWLKDYLIPLPSKSQQEAIVAELDEINSLLALKREQLKTYDKLAQSLFYEMFGDPVENEKGWEVKTILEVSTEKLSYGSGASAIEYDGQLRYIRITDIDDNGSLKQEKVSPNVFDEKYLLEDGDILFARSGATVGKTFMYKQDEGECIFAGYLIRMKPNKDYVLPNYVLQYTQTPYYKSFIESNQRVVAQPNINAQQYGALKICVPPLALQHQFATRIEQIESQKQQVKLSIERLETLFASRMQYWFE